MATGPEDYPQIWQKPAFEALLECLKKLRVDPPVWNLKISRSEMLREQDTTVQHRREIAAYLSSVIKSNLGWIDDEEQREQIWTEASKRLSERCGRAAMGEIIRCWPLESDAYPAFELTIKEPPLTGDSLGLKTWGSSYLLAQMLHTFASGSLAHLISHPQQGSSIQVLELGSGTGLLGLAAATIWRTHVVLSDLPSIMPNLASNVEQNRPVIEAFGGSVDAGALTWGGEEHESDQALFQKKNQFEIAIVADPLYDDNHPNLLAGTIDEQLSLDGDARALIMVPQRDESTKRLLADFRESMKSKERPLICVEEGRVGVQDDWESDQEAPEVHCWWGIFRRK